MLNSFRGIFLNDVLSCNKTLKIFQNEEMRRHILIQAVGFDLDDTLYDRYAIYRNVYRIMETSICETGVSFEKFNRQYQFYSAKEYQLFIEGKKRQLEYQVDRVISTYKSFNYDISKDEAIIFNALYEYYRSKIEFRPGFIEFINELKEKDYRLFVLTNGTSEGQNEKLNKLGMSQYIEPSNWFISEDVGLSKPDQRIFEYVQQSLSTPNESIVFIGDHLVNDCVPAAKQGWQPIYFNFDNQINDQLNCPEICHFSELLGQF